MTVMALRMTESSRAVHDSVSASNSESRWIARITVNSAGTSPSAFVWAAGLAGGGTAAAGEHVLLRNAVIVVPDTGGPQRARAERAIGLLRTWIADRSGYDEETWPKVSAALEEDRLSTRKLFDGK